MTPAPSLCRVVWTDAVGDAQGWTATEDLERTPAVVTTVGHLVDPSPRPDHVTVALSWYDDPVAGVRMWDSIVAIPTGMVVTFAELPATR